MLKFNIEKLMAGGRKKNIDLGIISLEFFCIFGIMYMGINWGRLNPNGKMKKWD